MGERLQATAVHAAPGDDGQRVLDVLDGGTLEQRAEKRVVEFAAYPAGLPGDAAAAVPVEKETLLKLTIAAKTGRHGGRTGWEEESRNGDAKPRRTRTGRRPLSTHRGDRLFGLSQQFGAFLVDRVVGGVFAGGQRQ